jgi:hypothetical protein
MNKYLEYFMQERKRERELELKFVGFGKSQFAIIYFSYKGFPFLFFSSFNKLNQNVKIYNVKC